MATCLALSQQVWLMAQQEPQQTNDCDKGDRFRQHLPWKLTFY